MIPFVYQKLLHDRISKGYSTIKEFYFFPNFVVKLKAFELTYDCLILYFPAVFPVQNTCTKFQFVSMNISKVIAWRKLKKSLLNCKISKIFEFFPHQKTNDREIWYRTDSYENFR